MTAFEPLSAVMLAVSLLLSCGLLGLLTLLMWVPHRSAAHAKPAFVIPTTGSRWHGMGLRSRRQVPRPAPDREGPEARLSRAPWLSGAPGIPHHCLTPEERAALELLEHAEGMLARWPVPRAVACALRHRDLVTLTARNQQVILTPRGRDALADDRRSWAEIWAEYSGANYGGKLVTTRPYQRRGAALPARPLALPGRSLSNTALDAEVLIPQ